MARIYVSSTFTDLQDHREAVRNAIRRMGHFDVAMEYYVAEDRRPLDKCLADVRTSDLYIIIQAWRYGHIPPDHTESITHLEYRTALDANKPCLAFVLDEKAPWPPHLMELDQLPRVQTLRTTLLQDHLAGLFTTRDDLARQVTEALQQWERNQTGQPTTTTNWDAYRQAVFDKYKWVVLSVIAGAQHDRLRHIPLLDVYVAPRLRAGRPHYDLPEWTVSSTPEDSDSVLCRELKQVLLGGPGSGKSTMFLAIMLDVCDRKRLRSQVPFLVELREYTLRGCTDFIAYLRDAAWDKLGVRITEHALIEVLSEGKAWVFFDGLDEIFEPAARARVIDQFHAFTTRFPKAWVAVSSRIVGYDESSLGLAGFTHYTLLDFGLIEIGEFVPKWYQYYTLENDERDAVGLVRRISENPRLLELASNPLLLTMMAIIYKHQDLPEKRWQLYARCTAVLLEDWDVKRKKIDRDELLPFPMTADQKAEILQNIAMAMISRPDFGQELNAIGYEPLRDIVAGYLGDQYDKPPGEAQAIAVEILNHLRERTYILAETGERVFGFVHRTFMEYFAARHVLAEFNRNKADYEWLKREVFLKYWSIDRWREPLLLLIGMLSGQGSPIREVVDALMSLRDRFAAPFAARCLGEASQVPPGDRPWASAIMQTLVRSLDRSRRHHFRDDYVQESIAAFGSLAPFVEISDDTRRLIDKFDESKFDDDRFIGWQLRLALGSKTERRRVALDSLAHDDQEVRRGAAAALEREWPGDEVAFHAMTQQLRAEPYFHVREALISALDAGWPGRTEVLGGIERWIGTGMWAPHTMWVIEHLARAWAGDVWARELVLRIAARQLSDVGGELLDRLREEVASALVAGWEQLTDTRDFLSRAISSGGDLQAALTAKLALAKLDPDSQVRSV